MKNDTQKREYKVGMIAALSCSILWGILPIYWKALAPIDAWVIIFYRIFLVAVVSLITAYKVYGWEKIVSPFKDRKTRIRNILAGLVITVNWSIYIWAVNAGEIVQTSTGYYIEPLMVCVFGLVFFHEKLTKYKTVALILASLSVMIILIHFKEIPFIALTVAVSFAVYTALKKTVEQPPLLSLLYETILLAPAALIVVVYMEATGQGALTTANPYQYILLLLCGVVTVVPLALFARAATRLSMFTLGLTAYLNPTLQLLLGVLMYGEPFDSVQFMAFAVIWVGLGVFSYGEYIENKRTIKLDGKSSN